MISNILTYNLVGTEYDPQRGATRVALLSILAMMVIIFACYSAQMTAVLSVANVVMPFENVQGMYRDTNYKVGSVENTAFDNLFNVRKPFCIVFEFTKLNI